MKKILHKNRKGFSLVEAMMATVVLSMAAAGVLLPFSNGAAVQVEGMHRVLASKLAADLMEEIVNTPFDQIFGVYGAYAESQGQVRDAGGAVFTDSIYANFSRKASCEYVRVPQEAGRDSVKFIRATVRVYYRGEQIVIIKRLIGR